MIFTVDNEGTPAESINFKMIEINEEEGIEEEDE